MKHPNEVNLKVENLAQILEEAQALGKQYVHALREQMERQGITNPPATQQ